MYKFILVLLLAIPLIGCQEQSVKNYEQTVNGVLSITQLRGGGLGTGFVVAEKYIFTAGHVLKGIRSNQSISAISYDTFRYPAKVFRILSDLDVGVLQVYKPLPPSLPISCTPVRAGERVYIIGMPSGYPWIMYQGFVAHVPPSGVTWTLLDISGSPGVSGAPVIRERDQKVVGIVVRGLRRDVLINMLSMELICKTDLLHQLIPIRLGGRWPLNYRGVM